MAIQEPTEIQRACIPPILQGKAVIGGAKTGSGKTAAFALPILQKLSEDPYGVFALILTPTRELAFQIADQFWVLGKSINAKISTVVGGMDMMKQALDLSHRPHVIIATPGRLVDHLTSSSDTLHLSRLRFLVLDEADRLLSDTFAEDLAVVFDHIPRDRQTLLFTATMTPNILALQDAESDPAKKPFVHLCESSTSTVLTLLQYYLLVPSHVRESYLVHLLRSPDVAGKSVIIFVGKRQRCERMRVMLQELDIRCTALHSEMSQAERLDSLSKFRSSFVPILVSTDVASRGLDIPDVQFVVNFDLPRNPDDYIHRVGRTARAGRGGFAISLMTERDVSLVQAIEQRIGRQLEEYTVSENKVLEILNEVSGAKRIANMALHDADFGGRTRDWSKKHKQTATRQPPPKRAKGTKHPAL